MEHDCLNYNFGSHKCFKVTFRKDGVIICVSNKMTLIAATAQLICALSLRKHAHAINRDFLALKIENFQLKNFDIFLIVAQNIDCGYTLEPPRRGGSNEYPQSMFWSKNKKNR